MAARGRPPKYSEERAERLLSAVRAGGPLRHACAYAGISEDTLGRWRRDKADFAERLKEAEAASVIGALALIQQAAKQHWQAAAWILERRFPEEFSLTARFQHSHSGEVDLNDGTALERITGRIDELAARRAARDDPGGSDAGSAAAPGV